MDVGVRELSFESNLQRSDIGARNVPRISPGVQVARRFGAQIDVRNRGALRLSPRSDRPSERQEQPAVVRIWHGEACRELSIADARALAAQLNEAAAYAEQQNRGKR